MDHLDPLDILLSFSLPFYFLLLLWCSVIFLPSESFPCLSSSEHSPCLNKISPLVCLGHNYFFCYTIITTQYYIIHNHYNTILYHTQSLQHNTISYTIITTQYYIIHLKLDCVKSYKTILGTLVKITDFKLLLGFGVLP
jgi:hypothetical protein